MALVGGFQVQGSRSATRSRTQDDGWISGLGGWRIAVLPLSAREREGGADVVDGVFGGDGHAVAFGQPGGEIAVPRGGFLDLAGGLRQAGRRSGRLAFAAVSPAVPGAGRDLVLTVVIVPCAPGRGLRFGGGERGPGLAGVAMAELGVGGLGQAEPPALFVLGCLLVAYRGVEFGLACAVGVAHCLVAGGQRFLPGCFVVLAAAAGRAGFGVGAERCQVRVAGGGAGLAELRRRPAAAPGCLAGGLRGG